MSFAAPGPSRRRPATTTSSPAATTPAAAPAEPARSGSVGKPLDANTRQIMAGRFGHDFSRVRVFADAPAHEAADALEARAYTRGNDIVFGPNEYAPGTSRGLHLLAHELTHVVQQAQFGVPCLPSRAPLSLSQPGDAAEHEAQSVAARVAADRPALAPIRARPASAAIARSPWDWVKRQAANAAEAVGEAKERTWAGVSNAARSVGGAAQNAWNNGRQAVSNLAQSAKTGAGRAWEDARITLAGTPEEKQFRAARNNIEADRTMKRPADPVKRHDWGRERTEEQWSINARKKQTAAGFPRQAGNRVHTDIGMVKKVPEGTDKAFRLGEKWYLDEPDVDLLVSKKQGRSKPRSIERVEQIKSGTGRNDPRNARNQIGRNKTAFDAMADEAREAAKLGRDPDMPYEMVVKRGRVRKIVTGKFDVANSVAPDKFKTVGPKGMPYDEHLPLSGPQIKQGSQQAVTHRPVTPQLAGETPAMTRLKTLGKWGGKGMGVLGVAGGGIQAYGGVQELRGGKTVAGAANVGGGTANMIAGGAMLAGRAALGAGAGGVGALLDGGKDIYTGIRDGNVEKTATGGVKGVAGGMMLAGAMTGNPFLAGAGAVTYGGALVYENREAIGKAASAGAHWVGNQASAAWDGVKGVGSTIGGWFR